MKMYLRLFLTATIMCSFAGCAGGVLRYNPQMLAPRANAKFNPRPAALKKPDQIKFEELLQPSAVTTHPPGADPISDTVSLERDLLKAERASYIETIDSNQVPGEIAQKQAKSLKLAKYPIRIADPPMEEPSIDEVAAGEARAAHATHVAESAETATSPTTNAVASIEDPVTDEVATSEAESAETVDYPSTTAAPLTEIISQDSDVNYLPRTIDDTLPKDFREMSLDEAIEIGLRNATVLRSIGGQILQNPQATVSIYEPAIQMTDPALGVEAALAQFDAQFTSNATFQKNDNVFNNSAQVGSNEIKQDLFQWNFGLSKTAATGTQFSLNSNVEHDNNNALTNLFDHSWSNSLEATIRQPLLQGGGVHFNRVAGPNGRPGFRFSNGVVIAQMNDQITAGDFQRNVETYVNDAVSAYWQLYLAYRNYMAAAKAEQTSYETWRIVEARNKANLQGGEADRESQAREQMLLFEQQSITALSGDQRTGQTGVYQAEANLRRLLGLAQRELALIRPSDSPIEAKISYDWDHLVSTAYRSRVELRQQRLRVRQSEEQLIASKNFLLPRLDAIATYRINGFGDDLTGGGGRFSSANKDFFSGDHQESEIGLQLSVPLGFRREYAGLRNAQLSLQRERAVLVDQQEQVSFQLGNALRQVALDYQAMKNAYNRLVAADQTVEARFASFEADKIPMDFLLESQERRARAENAFHQAIVNYELSRTTVERESGNLLNHFNVQFAPRVK